MPSKHPRPLSPLFPAIFFAALLTLTIFIYAALLIMGVITVWYQHSFFVIALVGAIGGWRLILRSVFHPAS